MVAVLNDFPYVFRIPRYLFFTYIYFAFLDFSTAKSPLLQVVFHLLVISLFSSNYLQVKLECCENLWEQGKTHKYAKGLKGFARTQKRTPAYHKHHRLWLWDPRSSENPDPNQWEPVLLLWQTCHPGGLEDAGIKMSCNCVAHHSWMCNPFTEVSLHHFKKGSPKAEVGGVIRIHFHATISIYFIQIQSMMHNTYCSTLRKSAWLSQSRACQVKKNIYVSKLSF
jgi:hypothetical protein